MAFVRKNRGRFPGKEDKHVCQHYRFNRKHPLVKIQTINPVPGVTILAKLEYMNPGGSIKDRAALYMINQAEADGELTPEKTVIEATSEIRASALP